MSCLGKGIHLVLSGSPPHPVRGGRIPCRCPVLSPGYSPDWGILPGEDQGPEARGTLERTRVSPLSEDIHTPAGGNSFNDKRVLLRERKRHTNRGVSSTPSVVLYGGGGTSAGGGTLGHPPIWTCRSTPPARWDTPTPRLDLSEIPPAWPGGVPRCGQTDGQTSVKT